MANSKTAVLVVVGLLVGVVAGYGVGFVVNQSQIAQLQSDLSETETALSASQSEAESLQGQLADAETQISNLTSNLDEAGETIADREMQISNLESDLTDAAETISDLESDISYLQSLLVPEQGYVKFAAYGFSFEYPKQMHLLTQGVVAPVANMHSGIVATVRQDGSQMLLVGWNDQEYPKDLNFGLEEAFEAFGPYAFTKGQVVSSTMRGHEMLYQDFTVSAEGKFFSGVVGCWNCDVNEMLFFLFYIDVGEDALTPFLQYLDSFVCH